MRTLQVLPTALAPMLASAQTADGVAGALVKVVRAKPLAFRAAILDVDAAANAHVETGMRAAMAQLPQQPVQQRPANVASNGGIAPPATPALALKIDMSRYN